MSKRTLYLLRGSWAFTFLYGVFYVACYFTVPSMHLHAWGLALNSFDIGVSVKGWHWAGSLYRMSQHLQRMRELLDRD